MKKQIAVLSLLISAMGWAQEDKPQAPKKEKEIKEVTITINLFIFSIITKFSK